MGDSSSLEYSRLIDKMLYHSFKHHFRTTHEWIKRNKGNWNDEIYRTLQSIGHSQLDYYIGTNTEDDIKQQLAEKIFLDGCYNIESYSHWVNKYGKDYNTIELNDGSEWTLRLVSQPNYIHIHPSRYSMHTLRIKANVLKTVVCTLLLSEHTNYDAINNIRTTKLALSPINVTKVHNELDTIFQLFKS